MNTLVQFGGALYAAVVAGLGSVVTVLVGDVGIGDLSDGQWAVAILAALVAFGGVLKLPPSGSSAPPGP